MAYLYHCRKIQEEKNKVGHPIKPNRTPCIYGLYTGGVFMSDVKKLRFLKPETVEKLKLCMEMAGSDAVDLMTEAYGQDVFDKEGRGGKVWLYKGAKEALTCMEKLNRVLLDDELSAGDGSDRKVSPEAQAAALLESVAKKLEERKQRPS